MRVTPMETRRQAGADHVVTFARCDPPGRMVGICWRAELHEPESELPMPLAVAYLSDYRDATAFRAMLLDYVLVPDHLRRRGYASRLIAECRREWPGLILTDAISPEGEALLESVDADEVPS